MGPSQFVSHVPDPEPESLVRKPLGVITGQDIDKTLDHIGTVRKYLQSAGAYI